MIDQPVVVTLFGVASPYAVETLVSRLSLRYLSALVGLAFLGAIIALLAGQPITWLAAAGPAAIPTTERPFTEIYLPLIMRGVGRPFPTDPPPAPTMTPTVTATRRPTITLTAMPSETVTPTQTPSSTVLATTTPTGTSAATGTPTATNVTDATGTASPSTTATATPLSSLTPTATRSTPSATPTPGGQVVILNARSLTYTLSGQTWLTVVGEVQNQSSAAVTDVVVTINLRRDDLLVLATYQAEVFADRLGPMQTAPFRLVVAPPNDYDNNESRVTDWRWSAKPSLPTLAPPTGTYQSSDGYLYGQITNTANAPIQHTRVVAVYRSIDGAIANVADSGGGSASPFGLTLVSGQTTPFRMTLTGGAFPGEPSYTILYEPATAPAPSPLPTRGLRVATGNGNAEIYGELTNTTAGPIDETQVTGTFYDATNRVVAAGWVWSSENADRILNPGVTAPFVLTLSGPGANSWTRYTIQTAYRLVPQPLPSGVSIDNPSFSVSLDDRTLTLRGTVVNGANVALARPRLVVTFYQGNVVYYAVVAELTDAVNLAPGRNAPCIVTAPLPPGIGAGLAGASASYAIDYLPN